MAELSYRTISEQVKRNLLRELIDKAFTEPKYQDELFEFLTAEQVTITPELLRRIDQLPGSRRALGRVRVTSIADGILPPRLAGVSPASLWRYGVDWMDYFVLRFFVRYLKKTLWNHDELQAMQLAEFPNTKDRNSKH